MKILPLKTVILPSKIMIFVTGFATARRYQSGVYTCRRLIDLLCSYLCAVDEEGVPGADHSTVVPASRGGGPWNHKGFCQIESPSPGNVAGIVRVLTVAAVCGIDGAELGGVRAAIPDLLPK